MNVETMFFADKVGFYGLKLLRLDWALNAAGEPFPNVLIGRTDCGALVFWDGYGCDAESMPRGRLYISTPAGNLFATELGCWSIANVNALLAPWTTAADMDLESLDAGLLTFEDKWCWVLVS